jgi:hypothetical protein
VTSDTRSTNTLVSQKVSGSFLKFSTYLESKNFFFNLHSGGWNQGPLDTAATNGLLCQPRVIMIGRGNRSPRRKPAPVPLCPPQTPHAPRTRTRAAAVGSQRLTAELRHGLILKVMYMCVRVFADTITVT